jgi:hypothetical protein
MHEYAGTTISSTNLQDMVQYPFQVIEVQGIMPNYFETIVPGFVVEHYSHLDQKKGWLYPFIGHPEASDLSFGELLYTPRGSQGIGTTGFWDEQIKVKRLYDQEYID